MIQEAVKPYSILAREFDLSKDEPLRKYTSFRIGGPADLFAQPEDKFVLQKLLERADALDIPVTIFGGGTNLLISDKGVRGLVIFTNRLRSKIKIIEENSETKTIRTDAGERLSKLCQFAINNHLSGLEFAAGIPGTVGGAVKMNAGIKSGDMSSIVRSIEVLDPDQLTFETIDHKQLEFSYRYLQLSGIIVRVDIQLTNEDQKKIDQNFKYNLMKKNANQPVSFYSAGCFFKNPVPGVSAGELIEKSGLKGACINDAAVSEKHCNFIINLGNASCEDVMRLKQHIQQVVYKQFNIQLEAEVKIEGE